MLGAGITICGPRPSLFDNVYILCIEVELDSDMPYENCAEYLEVLHSLFTAQSNRSKYKVSFTGPIYIRQRHVLEGYLVIREK